MTLRPPTLSEQDFLSLRTPPEWIRVVDEGEVTGFVCASRIEGHAWIHELHYTGKHPEAVLMMIRAAKTQVKEWGFDLVLVNTYNDDVKRFLEKKGFQVTQTIMKGAI